jgi:spermidine synthase
MLTGGAERRAVFAVLFFLSGAAGLVYEQLWIRELQHFFGSTIHSITTVVAAYMGGLGLGAWAMGRRADRHSNPAMLYGILELAIGVFGIASPLLFSGTGAAYLALARVIEPGLWLATAVKFVFAFVIMLVPTFLMGATLPILTRAFAGPRAISLRRDLALFYGLNTVGGVAGCLLAGFVLIEHVGMLRSLLGTGVLNLALGAAAIAITRKSSISITTSDELPAVTADYVAAPPVEDDLPSRRIAIWVIGLTAFASLLYEIAWTRVLVMVVGSSTYAFTTILSCFLLGIGLGSLIAIGRGRSARDLLKIAALVQGLIAVTAALLFPFFRALPVYIVATLQVQFLSPSALIALHSLALAAVVIPPAIGMGLAFPILAEAAANRSGGTGSETGRAYFANTIGSILGSVVTGFVLIHTIGSERTLELGIILNAALAFLIVWHVHGRGEGGFRLPEGERSGPLLAVLALVITFFTPSWSTRLLDRGPAIYGRDRVSRPQLDNFLRALGAEQLHYDEGWNATISVWRNGGATWLKSNGKSDASSVADMNTQVLIGLLPTLAHPDPRNVFLVGLGSGVTANVVSRVPGVERVDVVEIESAVVTAARFFEDVNGGVVREGRVNLIADDARSALQLARSSYDVIVSEPSNPWVAGIAALFTAEYFRIVSSRLAENGVFAQWVQTYRVPPSVVAVVVANLREVFPHVEMWFSNPSDLILVASHRPIEWRYERLAALADTAGETGRQLRDWVAVNNPGQLLGHFLLGDRGTAALAAEARFPHTDDRPALEFVAARSLLGGTSVEVFDSLLGIRNAVGDSLPGLDAAWRLRPGEWHAAAARALPPANRFTLPLAEEAVRRAADEGAWRVVLGQVLVRRERFNAADEQLRLALRSRPNDASALLHASHTAAQLEDSARSRELLSRALAAGGDTVYAMSALALAALDAGDAETAARLTTRALRALRPTIAMPFPGALDLAVRRLAWEGPPQLAAQVLAVAREARASWDLAWHGGAVALLRQGPAQCADAAHLASELTRFGWSDSEIVALLRPCLVR